MTRMSTRVASAELDRVLPAGVLQRKWGCDGGAALQRSTKDQTKPCQVPPIVYDVLRSPGEALAPSARTAMEGRFKHDFSRIRVHTSAKANESARQINALAYTAGDHIVFDAGQFQPSSSGGERLLAHELAHTIQQERTSPPADRFLTLVPVDHPAEREAVAAETDAAAVVSAQPAATVHRQQADAGAGVTLTYTKSAPVQGRCGDFQWWIRWVLQGATSATNGFIVQKVRQARLTQNCDDTSDDFFQVYWEAWRVKDGKILAGTSETEESRGDSFSWGNTMGSKGTTYVSGTAKFMENYTEPFTWKRVEGSGSLRGTLQQPAGWSESGSKYRYVGISDYSCCDNKLVAGKLNTEELDV